MDQLIEIKTPRLHLRQWRGEDRPVFAKLNADPMVMKYYPKVLSTQESDAMADKIESLIAEKGWGFWAVEKLDDEQFIGFVGLNKPTYELPVKECVEIGWRLAKDYWGQGYATEAARASLAVAFEKLDLPEVYSFASVANKKSRAVMQRLGMSDTRQNFEHPIIPENHPLREHVLYKIDKQSWSKKGI